MRFLLLVAVCSLAALAAAGDKEKRDILPGDPRFGTDYHKKNHHAYESKLQVSKSLGGYVGTFSDDSAKTAYGPPDYQPGKPIVTEQFPTVIANTLDVSSSRSDVPEIQSVTDAEKQYLPPVVIESKIKQFHVPKTTVHKETLHTDYGSPTVPTPVSLYGPSVTVETKTTDQVYDTPVASYGVPSLKATVEPTSNDVAVDITLKKAIKPLVKDHDHGKEEKTIIHNEVKTPLTLSAGVTHDTPNFDTRFLDSNTGVLPSTDFSSFSNSFNQPSTIGSQVIAQPGLLNFASTYGLQDNNHQFNTHFPSLYASQFGGVDSYGIPLVHPYHGQQSIYNQNTYPSISSQYSGSLPYPLAKTSLLFQGSLVDNQKTGPISDFFQQTFPNFQFPQLPQLPQIPNLGSLFQLPTQAPQTVPADAVDVQKSGEAKLLNLNDQHVVGSAPFGVERPLVKDTSFVTKLSDDFVQPVDSNGGYIY